MLRNPGLFGQKREILIVFQKWMSVAPIFVVFDLEITEESLVPESRCHERNESRNLTQGPSCQVKLFYATYLLFPEDNAFCSLLTFLSSFIFAFSKYSTLYYLNFF